MALSGRSSDTGLEIYRYDAFNRLTNYNSGSDEASYTYSANNLRASKTVNREKTNFVWNGQNLAAESRGEKLNTYTYDITGVHMANQNGTVTSYLKDYHGNVIGKTTKTGVMFNEMGTTTDYDAFGNRWQGDAPDPFGYCGEYLDNESGLIYLRNRYYDSTSGRFITEDPVKDGLNWYSYCAGNPINAWDPSGLVTNPDNGVKGFIELIANITELMDNQINYCNTQVPDPTSKDLIYYKSQANKVREKIRNSEVLSNSPELRKLINNVVCDDVEPSLQKISSVVAVLSDITDNIIGGYYDIGDEVMSERDVRWKYTKYDEDDKIRFTSKGTGIYAMSAEQLMIKLLYQNFREYNNYSSASGNDIQGNYYDVINIDKSGFSKEPFEQENIVVYKPKK